MKNGVVAVSDEETKEGGARIIESLADEIWEQTNGPALTAYHRLIQRELDQAKTIEECRQLVEELDEFYREALIVGRNQGISLGFVIGRLAMQEPATDDRALTSEQFMRLMGEPPLDPTTRRILATVEAMPSGEM